MAITRSGPGGRYLYYKEHKRVGKKVTTPVSIYLGPANAASTGIKLAALLGTNYKGTRDKMFGEPNLEHRKEAEHPTIIAELTVAKEFTSEVFDREAQNKSASSEASAMPSFGSETSDGGSEPE